MILSTYVLPSKYTWLLVVRVRFSSKCWCGQFVCLKRERSSHHSLDNKSIQSTCGRLGFSPSHSLRKLACNFPLLCILSKKEEWWLSSLSSRFLSRERRPQVATAELCARWKHRVPVSAQQHITSFIAEAFSAGMTLLYCGEKVSMLLQGVGNKKLQGGAVHLHPSLPPKNPQEQFHLVTKARPRAGARGGACLQPWHWVSQWLPNHFLVLQDVQIVLPRDFASLVTMYGAEST